jgi:hypothetical protein
MRDDPPVTLAPRRDDLLRFTPPGRRDDPAVTRRPAALPDQGVTIGSSVLA